MWSYCFSFVLLLLLLGAPLAKCSPMPDPDEGEELDSDEAQEEEDGVETENSLMDEVEDMEEAIEHLIEDDRNFIQKIREMDTKAQCVIVALIVLPVVITIISITVGSILCFRKKRSARQGGDENGKGEDNGGDGDDGDMNGGGDDDGVMNGGGCRDLCSDEMEDD